MKESKKAKLITVLIIATIAFAISTAVASTTIKKDSDSYKLIQIKNDSFTPAYINKVPTIIPKNDTNSTDDNNTKEIENNIADNVKDSIVKIENTNQSNETNEMEE